VTHDTALPLLRQRSRGLSPCPLPAIEARPAPTSLYLHVPFCFHKCHYCDFYSIVDSRGRQAPFAARLEREIDALAAWHAGRGGGPLETIFIGGGTPTLLEIPHWDRILAAIGRSFDLSADLEFTVECNPETASAELFALLASGAVNRISIGAQSFDPHLLRVLERWHDPDNVGRAIQLARGAGIGRASLDLIFAIPGQTCQAWDADLRRALALDPDHLSCYCLTFEPGTAITQKRDMGRIVPTSDEVAAEMQEHCLRTLDAAGFARYEVSNFARPGEACRHNLAYWRQDQWLAAGPSASAHVGGHRWKVDPHLDRYLSAQDDLAPVTDHETPDPRRALAERLMTGLRIAEGVAVASIMSAGADVDPAGPERLQRAARDAVARGWLHDDDATWRPTDTGFLFADALALSFMSALDPDDRSPRA
jgi:oxygen-independent coproporphyrinogen-3 oxidase